MHVHDHHPRVKEALSFSSAKKNEYLKKFKREGIMVFNISEASKKKPRYQRERKGRKAEDTKLSFCNKCSMFMTSKEFQRHRRDICKNSGANPSKAISTSTEIFEQSIKHKNLFLTDDFKKYILSKIGTDQIGKICRQDQTILKLGSIFYSKIKRKQDKAIQVRKKVRQDMRIIAHMYCLLRQQDGMNVMFGDAMDMFIRDNFPQLRSVIDIYTSNKDDSIKPGLKAEFVLPFEKGIENIESYFIIGKERRCCCLNAAIFRLVTAVGRYYFWRCCLRNK